MIKVGDNVVCLIGLTPERVYHNMMPCHTPVKGEVYTISRILPHPYVAGDLVCSLENMNSYPYDDYALYRHPVGWYFRKIEPLNLNQYLKQKEPA